ncbi:MAG: histidine kinase [Actinoallomurus sp.]|nr:histidine kinase [Actinoallomurus sp.]
MNGTVGTTPSRLRRLGPVRLAGESPTWRSAAYLLLHFPLGLAYFISLVVLLSVSAGTVIIWVGVLGLALTMILWRGAAMLERRLVRLAFGVEVPSPYRTLPQGGNPFKKWKAMAVDPATWKDLVYLLLAFPIGVAEFTMSVVLWSASLALITMPVSIIWQQAGFIRCAVWRPRPWGRGGNVAPSWKCRWWSLACSYAVSS